MQMSDIIIHNNFHFNSIFPQMIDHIQSESRSIDEGLVQISSENQNPQPSIPFDHLIHNPKKDLKKTLELCKQVYDAAYFMKNLPLKIRHLVEHQTQAKSIMLNGPNNKNKHSKTLFLDLDETLIHTSFTTSEGFNQQIEIDGKTIWFNLRPYAFEFLKNMAELYELVLFTASEKKYAEAFYEYINARTDNSLSFLLCRDNCIHIYKSLYFKDFRIITNRNLKDVVLLDNSPYCFGLHMDNGVPISAFTKDHSDIELLYMEAYLRRLSFAEDVQEFNRKQLRLTQILTVKKVSH